MPAPSPATASGFLPEQMPTPHDPNDSIEFAWKMAHKWTSDLTPGETAWSAHARIMDTFKHDPIMSMFVPQMRDGFANALMQALTVPAPGDQSTRTVSDDMDPMRLEEIAAEVYDASALTVLSDKARSHVIRTLLDGLYPHATLAARTE